MKLRRGTDRNPDDATMSLLDHLRELRGRIIKAVVAVVVFGVVIYFLYDRIYFYATRPYCDAIEGTQQQSCGLISLSLIDGFALRLKVATYLGVFCALPVIFWQLWRFVAPGLYRKERRYALGFVGVSTFLFALGGVTAYYSLAKAFQWLITNSGPVQFQNTADGYFSLLAIMILAFGIGFEYPLVVFAIQATGLVEPATLAKYRRHAMVGVVAVVAIVTPGGDPVSLFALSIPLIVFYEVALIAGRILIRRRA